MEGQLRFFPAFPSGSGLLKHFEVIIIYQSTLYTDALRPGFILMAVFTFQIIVFQCNYDGSTKNYKKILWRHRSAVKYTSYLKLLLNKQVRTAGGQLVLTDLNKTTFYCQALRPSYQMNPYNTGILSIIGNFILVSRYSLWI